MSTNTPSILESVISKKDKQSMPLTSGEYISTFKSSFFMDSPTETVVKKDDEVIKSEEHNPIYDVPTGNTARFLKTPEAIHIVRTHYTKQIIEHLNWLSENHEPGSLDSISEFQQLFTLINDVPTKSPTDPYSSILLSLYQGLVYEEKWTSIEPKVLSNVSALLKSYSNRRDLSYDDIDKALLKLEDLGINPTPFY